MKRNETEYFTEWSDCESRDDFTEFYSSSNHMIETELANLLNSKSGLEFDRLVVRRLPGNSICLEGSFRSDDENFNLNHYIKGLLGVDEVINRLVHRPDIPCGEETQCVGEDTVVDWS